MPYYVYKFYNNTGNAPGFDTYEEAQEYLRQFSNDKILDYYIQYEIVPVVKTLSSRFRNIPTSFESNFDNDINRIATGFGLPPYLLSNENTNYGTASTSSIANGNSHINAGILEGLLTDFSKKFLRKNMTIIVNICYLKPYLKSFREHDFTVFRKTNRDGFRLNIYDIWYENRFVAVLIVNIFPDAENDKLIYSMR